MKASMLAPLSVLWPSTTIVAGGASFDSKRPMRWLSTKCDDAPQSEVMVNFSGPGVVESAKNEQSMPDGGDSMTLYSVGVAWDRSSRDSNRSRRSSNRSRWSSNRSRRSSN